ncbi:MAG: ferredoxin [Actinomycetales bacterium]
MQITIKADRCQGHGRCYSVAPTLLSDADDGSVAQKGQTWTVPDGLQAEAEEAADACPETAIVLESDV